MLILVKDFSLFLKNVILCWIKLSLEKQEMLEQLKRKGLYGTVGFKKMLEEQETWYMA